MRTSPMSLAALILLAACGTEEAATEPEPEPTVAEEPAPPPPPEPEPEPEPIADCPTETWSVGTGGENQAAASGVEAAGLARRLGAGWERFRACKSIDGFEHLMSCAPVQGGAECSVSLPDEVCNATLPQPVLPVAVGQWVDTHAVPSDGSWSCHRR